MMRINIGCGQSPTKTWRNFDNSLSLKLSRVPLLPKLLLQLGLLEGPQYEFIQFCRVNAIEYGDATKGLPIPSGTADVLYSSHMFEHLDQKEAAMFLREARRVLRAGGILRLAVPDIRMKIRQYLDTNDADAFIFDTRMTCPRPRTFAQRIRLLVVGTRHHQWMYDGSSLSRILQAHGFINTVVLEAGVTQIERPGELDLYERASESVYVEATNP